MQGDYEELRAIMASLSAEQQRLVLDYARSLANRGVPGRDLLRFAGCISKKDAREMMAAIEEGCERVDPQTW